MQFNKEKKLDFSMLKFPRVITLNNAATIYLVIFNFDLKIIEWFKKTLHHRHPQTAWWDPNKYYHSESD